MHSIILKPSTVPTDALNNIKSQSSKIVKTIIFAPICFGSYWIAPLRMVLV
jgi:hypothetical protein